MTYKTLRLNIDERIYPQFIAFLRLLPAERYVIQEEEISTTAKNQLAALAGSWEGEELRRAPQESIAKREEIE